MTDKPQTLAEQIRVMYPPFMTPDQRVAWDGAISRAAALADAAATTTPVVGAEQGGDVRQAWRVKPLVWHNYDAWTWWAESISGTYRVEERNGTWRATLNLPMTEHIIYEYETDGTPNDFEAAHLACESDHAARITAALEPDPTPALGWRAMQTAAIAAQPVTSANPDETIRDRAYFDGIMAYAKAILAITGPTADQLLEEAVKLEAVRELVRAAKWIGVVAQTTGGTAGPDIDLIEAIDVLANAIAKIGEAK